MTGSAECPIEGCVSLDGFRDLPSWVHIAWSDEQKAFVVWAEGENPQSETSLFHVSWLAAMHSKDAPQTARYALGMQLFNYSGGDMMGIMRRRWELANEGKELPEEDKVTLARYHELTGSEV